MGKYKISLLTAVSDDNSSYFLPTVLGYANEQIKYDIENRQIAHRNSDQSLCYTYNEKYSQHQNAQKELTFSMDRKILMHDEWLTNPHTANLHVGSIIELEDKYNNTILFIVKKIQYTFKEHNITYNYTCQDAFSYQYTRQQSGYTIENDAASEDFIGPKTIDWWVIKKIVPECYIKYNYIPLQLGVYKDKNNKYYTFTEADRNSWTNDKEITRIIVKEPFTNSEFQTPIIFSCSGSNANAALISLGENLDLMLHSCEIKQEGKANKYHQLFWYEPKQNQDITGLKYSPKTQISNFGLDFAGDSLTTVLNVNSHELGDDLITLIPHTPSIFINLFMTKDWLDSKFYPGYFTDFINGKNYKYSTNIQNSSNNSLRVDISGTETLNIKNIYNKTGNVQHFVGIKINDINKDNFTLPLLYDLYEDNWSDENETHIVYTDGENTYGFFGKENHLYLLIKDPENQTDGNNDYFYIIREGMTIPDHLRGKALEVYIGIPKINASTSIHITSATVYLRFYREFTEEEKSFATIADECPWLENRLIDFTYFLEQGIISRQEYSSLMSLLQNDLRIINGKLLFLTDSYFAAVKKKREILSNLTNKLDALGAAFNAEVVDPLLNGQQPDDLESTIKSYTDVFNLSTDSEQLLNYNEVLSDYFEKYLSAEQRFLSNVYAFRKYFNEPCAFSYNQDAGIYIDTLKANIDEIDSSKTSNNFIAFGTPTFKTWDGQKQVPLFYHEGSKYTPATLINETNKLYFFKPQIEKNKLVEITSTSPKEVFDFCQNNSYWLKKDDYINCFGSLDRQNIEMYQDGTDIYYKLSVSELKRLVIANNKEKYYLRNKSTYISFDRIRTDYSTISNNISWISLPNLLKYWDITNTDYTNITDWGDTSESNTSNFFWNYYKAFFPINEIYYKGPVVKNYSSTTHENDKDITTWTFETYNEKSEKDASTTYETYQPIYFAGNGALLKDWGPCANDVAVASKEKINSSWNYAAFNYSPKGTAIAQEVITGLTGFLVSPLRGIIGAAIAATSTIYHALCDETWCQWLTNTKAYRSFEGKGNTLHQINASKDMPLVIEKGIIDKTANMDTIYYNYDSYYANYATSLEASSQSMTQIALWNKLTSTIPDTNVEPNITWYIDYLKDQDIKIDSTNFNINNKYNFYEYHNFYKYIVASYSFRWNKLPDKLFVKDKSFRILTGDSKLNKYDSYIRIPIYERTNDNTPLSLTNRLYVDPEENTNVSDHQTLIYIKNPAYFTGNTKLFSSLTWYPLYSTASDLNISSLDIWKERQNISLRDLIELSIKGMNDIEYTIENNGIVTFKSTNAENKTCSKYIYAHIEEYFRYVFNNSKKDVYIDNKPVSELIYAIDEEGHSAFDSLPAIYSIEDDRSINPLNEDDALNLQNLSVHLYMISEKDSAMIPITSDDDINALHCYKQIISADKTIAYERIYSQQQILDCINQQTDTEYCTLATTTKFKYIENTSAEFTNFLPNTTEFFTNIYLCKLETDTDNNIKLTTQKYDENYKISMSAAPSSLLLTLNDKNGEEYQSIITLEEIKKESLVNISNGTFWYRYHTRIEWPTLAEYAAVIETQLQIYWDQAYTASKYCKYFLPQYWQPTNGNTKNAFAKDIIVPLVNESSAILNVTLSNTYLPEVEIYKNDQYENFKYKHYLTKYIWNYRPNSNPSKVYADSNEEILAEQEKLNNIPANNIPILVNNKAITDIMTHLNTELSDWEVSENGYTVYYYESGEKTGMLWSTLVNEAIPSATLDHLDGLYGMMFYLLKNNYVTNNLLQYEGIKEQKENLWNKIYTDYPFLMLEDNYTYTLATTSEELLKMAKLVFKGKKQPEKGYSVSIIDTKNLEGYIGQELKPGQGIEINASEYYDENDDIYKALSQYLFITDISYSLRDDTNISITVNSIKYQEKLLQSLVKLIR